jgi:enterochelin esterase-like enzyme
MEPLPTVERTAVADWVTPAALDERLAAGAPFPIVEPERCTLAYRGEVISVRLMHFGVGMPDDLTYEPLDDESGWFVLPLAMPPGTRLEYKLEVQDSYGTHLVDDPLNPHDATHPFGANSVCVADGYETPWWALPDDAVPGGRLVECVTESAALGRETRTKVYLPAGFDVDGGHRHPLLVVLDGTDYLLYASGATVLDRLIAAGELPPTVVAFTQPVDRLVEYAADDRQHRHIVEELVPELERDVPCIGTPAGRVLMGCSFGGVSTLSTAASAPGFFGRLLIQSGSFAGAGVGCRPRPERLWRPVRQFVGDYMRDPQAVADRVVVTCGIFESLICENRAIVPVLEDTGMDVRFIEQLDGHNWVSWRDALGPALPWLLEPG